MLYSTLALASIVLLAVLGDPLGIPVAVAGLLMLLTTGVLVLLVFVTALQPDETVLAINRSSGVLQTKCIAMPLEPRRGTVYCLVSGDIEGRGSTLQLLAIRQDAAGRWHRRCVVTGQWLDQDLPKLAPFLGAPVYRVALGRRPAPRNSLERNEAASSPSYVQALDLPSAASEANPTLIVGTCYRCGYPLAGLSYAARCPECGEGFREGGSNTAGGPDHRGCAA